MPKQHNQPHDRLRWEAVKDIPMEQVCLALKINHSTYHHINCPMANHPHDNTPSCKFYENNTFACFGCKAGGTTIELVAGVLELRDRQALEWLEKNILRVYSHRSSRKSELRDRLKRTSATISQKQRRTTSPQHNTNVPTLRGILHALVEQQKKKHAGTSEEANAIVSKKVDELHTYIDNNLHNTASNDRCTSVRQFIRIQLNTVEAIVNDLTAGRRVPNG